MIYLYWFAVYWQWFTFKQTSIIYNTGNSYQILCSRLWKIVSTHLFRRVFAWVIKTVQYDRVDISEEIDINKTSESKECMLCLCLYFKDSGYESQPYLCNGYHAVSMMAYDLKKIAILNAKGVDYMCILWGISKNDTTDRLNNSVLEHKAVLWKDFGVLLVANSSRFYRVGVMN